MKAFWWQGGIHIEPQTDEERMALASLTKALNLLEPVEKPSGFLDGWNAHAELCAERGVEDGALVVQINTRPLSNEEEAYALEIAKSHGWDK